MGADQVVQMFFSCNKVRFSCVEAKMSHKQDARLEWVNVRYRGSYTSAHVLLNLLNELRKASHTFYLFFAMSLIDSIKQEYQC